MSFGTQFPISPHVVYHWYNNQSNATTSLSPALQGDALIFKNSRKEKCSSHLLCSSLNGNICGDFGLHLDKANQSKCVCYEQKCYLGSVEPGHHFNISLWNYSDAEFEAECFFWCTETGQLPPAPPNKSKDKNILNQLVFTTCSSSQSLSFIALKFQLNSTGVIKPVKLSPESEVMKYGSPAVIYKLQLSLLNDTMCSYKSRCWQKAHFMWNDDKSVGKFSILCTALSGNPCGDYTLAYSIK